METRLRLALLGRYLLLISRAALLVMLAFSLPLGMVIWNSPSPWVTACLLFLGLAYPVGMVLVDRHFHRDELPLYINHAVTPWHRYGAATLWNLTLALILLPLCSPLLRSWLQTQASLADTQLRPWLYSWGLWAGLGTMGTLVLVVGAIVLLSGGGSVDEAPDTLSLKDALSLEIDSVRHRFGDFRLLKGAYFRVRPHEVHAILGRNGCGKSTFFRIAMGEIRAEQKFLRVNGHPVRALYQYPGMIGYLSQRNFLPGHLRVDTLCRRFVGPQKAKDVLAVPRLARLQKSKIRELSGGEQRLLSLRLVLALEREFYFLDEPFSELEPLFKAEASAWIQDTARQKAVILTDHDYRQVLALKPRLHLMQHGEIRELADWQDLKQHYLL